MKQTNNAIKFLMAQYRAIFKNANLKMFLAAATAAAAMASSQAQATTDAWGNLKDTETLSQDVTYSGDAAVENQNGFNLTIESGVLTLHGGTGDATFSVKSGKDGIITQNGGTINLGDVATEGAQGKSGATLTVKTFTSNLGTLNIGVGAHNKSASKLDAETIVLGKASSEEGPTVVVGASGALGGATTKTLSVNAGTLEFSSDSTVTASESISIAGGTVTGPGNTKKLTLATPKLDITGGSLVIGSGSTVALSGSKASTISLAAGTVENQGGTLDLGQSGSTFTLATSDFNNDTGIFANKGKVTAASATDDKVYNITLKGAGTVDLGLILTDAGAKKADHLDLAAGKLNLTAEDATVNFSGNKIAVLQSGTFGELVAGKDGKLTVDATNLTVKKGLTVSGQTEGEFGELVLDTKASLTLDGASGKVNAKTFTVGSASDSGTFVVKTGSWGTNSLLIESGTASVEAGSSLVISGGDFSTKGANGKLTVKGSLDASSAGKVTLAAKGAALETGGKLILDQADVFTVSGDTVTLNSAAAGSTYAADAVSGDGSTVLQFNSVDAQTISAKAAADLKSKLQDFGGLLQFGGNLSLDAESIASGEKSWADVSGTATILGANDNVTLKEDDLTSVAALGNIKIKTDSTKEFTVKNTGLTLSNASANITDGAGKFVMDSTGATAGLKLSGAGSAVTLNGAGEIGSINGDAAGSGSILIGSDAYGKDSAVVVSGGIGDTAAVANVTVNGKANLTINAGADKAALTSYSLTIEHGGSIVAEGQKITIGNGADKVANIKGNIETKSLTLAGTGIHTIAGDAVVSVDTLNGTASGTINVGADGVPNGSATVNATKLVLNGATLNIDPNYGQHYASVRTMQLSGASGDTLDGLVNVGKNSVFAIGFDKAADVDAALGELIANGSFNDPTPPADTPAPAADPAVPASSPLATNALVLNKQIKVDTTNGGLHVGTNATNKAAANKFIVDADGAVVITDAVYSVDPVTGKKTGDAITLDNTGTAAIANGATVYLVGSFNGADDNLSILKGATATAAAQLKNFNVKVGSDLLDVAQNADGTFDISLTTDKARLATAFTDSSTPVRDLLLDVLDGHKIPFSTQAGYKFLDSVAKNPAKLGAAADAAAHAATYAGAQQAAVASVTTMAEAVGSRIGGLGVEATAIQATGSQANGGVWVTPMYKTVDADGFGAQGASYGADVDLAGVAFGTDTVNGNMRFGAVFNIGSGDADGKGNGNGLKDEFDYYGFGMYSVMGFGNFALVGDASLNVISHDVEGLGLKGEADTTAVTMGVTGQYTISNPMVDVTPHLGARFIRLDTDSYDLTSADGVIANTDFDVQNVFSVPLGVTLSKAFEMGGWALAPSADLSITFNTGDTDVESSTYFTGAKAINLTTEVLDEVTYGVALGLGAQYGAFGTAINVNYTGSENTDAFGVNAQARYMF